MNGGASAESVEACEEAAGAESLSAQAGRELPLFETVGKGRVGGLCVEMDEFGDVLEGLDQFVDAISLGEEDDELVDSVGGHGGGRRRWWWREMVVVEEKKEMMV